MVGAGNTHGRVYWRRWDAVFPATTNHQVLFGGVPGVVEGRGEVAIEGRVVGKDEIIARRDGGGRIAGSIGVLCLGPRLRWKVRVD